MFTNNTDINVLIWSWITIRDILALAVLNRAARAQAANFTVINSKRSLVKMNNILIVYTRTIVLLDIIEISVNSSHIYQVAGRWQASDRSYIIKYFEPIIINIGTNTRLIAYLDRYGRTQVLIGSKRVPETNLYAFTLIKYMDIFEVVEHFYCDSLWANPKGHRLIDTKLQILVEHFINSRNIKLNWLDVCMDSEGVNYIRSL
jgi:hypothetical protein